MSIRCRNCSSPIDAAQIELPAAPVPGADLSERDCITVHMRCAVCRTRYAVAIDVDEFDAVVGEWVGGPAVVTYSAQFDPGLIQPMQKDTRE